MRLTPEEVATITRLVAETYGPAAVVRLFGSQLDDRRKGGDIDLLVEVPEDAPREIWPELRLHAALEAALGERKVDLLVHRAGEEPGPFVRIARREGVPLRVSRERPRADEDEWTATIERASMSNAQDLLLAIFGTLLRTGEALRLLERRLAGRMPARPETVAAFDPDTRFLTDALLKRFEQHTDALRSAARTIVRLLGEADTYRTVRQVIDRLAGLEVIPDAARFLELVELRNRTVHAYAPESERQAAILNAVFGSIPELLDLAARFARFARAERLVPEDKVAAVAEALSALATAT
jgi:predicted nucleotidyltransferase/uncharacterized protein YutE (UPF0331/DUF86 family)